MKPKLRVGTLALRAVSVAVAAMCIAWGVAPGVGIASATIAAILAVVIGQLLGRTRLRLPVLLLLALLFGVGGFWIAGLLTNYEGAPRALGTGAAMRLAMVLRFGAVSFAIVGALRAVATRRPFALVLELSAIAGSIAYVFAAHRDGIISRPLWLSDWAWERGIDPVHVFLVLGGAAVVVLGLLLIAEAEERRGSAAAVLALFAVLGVVLVVLIGPPKADVDDQLGLTGPSDSASASASAAPAPPPAPPTSANPDGGKDDAGPKPQNEQPDGGPKPKNDKPDGGDEQPQNTQPDGGDQPQNNQPDGGGESKNDKPDGGSSDGGQSDGGGKDDGGDGGSTPPPQPASEDLENEREENQQSPSPMAIVLLESDYSPPSEVYYFRQEAWSQWNGTKLVRSSRADVDLDGLDLFPSEPTPVAEPIDIADREKVSAKVALLVDHTRPFALESPIAMKPLRNPNPQRFVRAYSFESHAQKVKYKDLRGKKVGNPKWSPEVAAYYLQGADDPRFAELAKQIVSKMNPKGKDDPFLQAVAVKLHLDDNFKYSRKEKHNADNPTADFLFGNKIGYCVHFAHAAVLLWRSLGLPSRVGTGYAIEEKNRQGGSAMMIRGADAHAWPELYIEGVGWVVLDITPHENLDENPPPVDEDLQRLLGEMAREMPPDPTQTEPPKERPDWRKWLRPAVMFLLSTIASLIGLLYLAKIWRRAAPMFAGPKELPRVGYRTSLDLLSEAGLVRDRGETREAFAKRVADRVPTFEKLTAMHLLGRLGTQRVQGEPGFAEDLGERTREVWATRLSVLRNELSKTPAWRRFLGFLNPLSFLRSR